MRKRLMRAHLAISLRHCCNEQIQDSDCHEDLKSEEKNKLNRRGFGVEDIMKLKVAENNLKCRRQ